jgi:hypothetical protein
MLILFYVPHFLPVTDPATARSVMEKTRYGTITLATPGTSPAERQDNANLMKYVLQTYMDNLDDTIVSSDDLEGENQARVGFFFFF